jgi:hypothetical protein
MDKKRPILNKRRGVGEAPLGKVSRMKIPSHRIENSRLLADQRTGLLKTGRGDLPKRFRTSEALFEDIRDRAETVTPVLRQILEFRPPPHWGINE